MLCSKRRSAVGYVDRWLQDSEGFVEELIRKDRWLPAPRASVPEGFVDFSQGLRWGIYALVLAGRVVFLGAHEKPLEMIAAHRHRAEHPRWLPIQCIEFDQVWIKPTHPDRAESELEELVKHYKPVYNAKRVLRPEFRRREIPA
jgi:hypothetical protein